MITLYTYWRSSAAYRVRMALQLKGIDYEAKFVHLLRDGGEQHRPEYRAMNPQGRVPTLVHGAVMVTQSLAIIEYLEESFPTPPLLPTDAAGRARVRSLAQVVAVDVQPLQNLSVAHYLKNTLELDDAQQAAWYQEWISRGLKSLETRLARDKATGRFCHGDRPSIADCCLVPQCYSSRRFAVDLDPYPTIRRIEAACLELEAVRRAQPESQPDRD